MIIEALATRVPPIIRGRSASSDTVFSFGFASSRGFLRHANFLSNRIWRLLPVLAPAADSSAFHLAQSFAVGEAINLGA